MHSTAYLFPCSGRSAAHGFGGRDGQTDPGLQPFQLGAMPIWRTAMSFFGRSLDPTRPQDTKYLTSQAMTLAVDRDKGPVASVDPPCLRWDDSPGRLDIFFSSDEH